MLTTSSRGALDESRIDLIARVSALALSVALAVATEQFVDTAGTLLMLSCLALAMIWLLSLRGADRRDYQYALVAEGVIASVVVLLGTQSADVFIIYIAAPAFLAGLRFGLLPMTAVFCGEAIAALGAQVSPADTRTDFYTLYAPWLFMSFATGVLGAWIRQLRLFQGDSPVSQYASAHRLLSQLRKITRDLPGGLDIEVVSENVLSTAVAALSGTRAALLLSHESEQLSVVAHRGDDTFTANLVDDPLIALSMSLRRVLQQPEPHGRASHRFRVCIPLVIGHRSIGCVIVDGPTSTSDDVLGSVQESLHDDALRLESAALFSDVKAIATVEERHRLAREIHDGIAQEIASMGYLVDDLARYECNQRHQDGLIALRDELTRVVTELRLSIFDLRSGVSNQVGLGSVLGDYVREIGKTSGMTVHLSLEESPRRLRLDVETELLRIGQEAVTNARKHSQGENLWVTCRVEPPFAELRIEDDGIGSVGPRQDHYGLHIMKERAARINAVLTIGDRVGGGTVVSAVLLPAESVAPTLNGETHGIHRFVG